MVSNAEETSINNKLKFCECGCGEQIPFWSSRLKQERKYKQGHQTASNIIKYRFTNEPRPHKRGPNNPVWKGGKMVHEGYILILTPGHPFAQKDGYVLEHRLVMEKHLCRYLKPDEVVHHINGIKTDNRIENLQLMTISEHIIHHNPRLVFDRSCYLCHKTQSLNYKHRTAWFRHPITRQEWLCSRCYHKIYYLEFTKKLATA